MNPSVGPALDGVQKPLAGKQRIFFLFFFVAWCIVKGQARESSRLVKVFGDEGETLMRG